MKTRTKLIIGAFVSGVFAVILAAVLILPLNRQNPLRFAFFLYDLSDTFIAEMMRQFISTIPDGVDFEVFDAGSSQSVQNRQIADALDIGFDIFIINPVDRLASGSIVERVTRDDIPIIFFNREPLIEALEGHENVFYVGAATDSQGRKQADLAFEFFMGQYGQEMLGADGRAGLVILKGEHGHQDAEIRTASSIDRLRELGFEFDILAIQTANWRRHDAFHAMRQLRIQFGDEIDLLFANNDDMALGAIDFLLHAEIFTEGLPAHEQPFIIVSVDGTPVGLEAVYNGLIFGTVQNDIAGQTDAILTLAYYVVTGQCLSQFPHTIVNNHFIYVYGDIITQENIHEHIA